MILSPTVVFKQGQFCPQGTFNNVWRHFGLSQLGLRGRGWQSYWHLVGRGRDAVQHAMVPRVVPQGRIIQPKTSAVLRWRNPRLL